jgi:glutamyl/glutaminyl-tRNA synthetase
VHLTGLPSTAGQGGSNVVDGAALARRLALQLPHAPLTRFAPAPTGFLHIGHVVNAIFVWGLARVTGGRVLLRIEDHDRQRARADYEEALLDDLDWLGFASDVFPTSAFRHRRCQGRQSERDAAYRGALAPLVSRGLVYGCECSRQQLAAGPYAGTCRERGIALTEGVGWRLRVDPREVTFDDGLRGWQRQEPATQSGDVLIRDRIGNWTYQWAATSDDVLQGITLVVRGEDLLDSTGRQIYLAEALGRSTPPVFVHHPLIMKSPTQKVSKSNGDTGVRDLRAAGWSASRVIGQAAFLAGLRPSPLPAHASEVERFFMEPRV